MRLKSIGEIPYPENLYVLDCVLRGFDLLSKMFGCFEPMEEMVGVDCEGRVKVWVNRNLALCYPEKGVKMEMGRGEMVRRVIEMVQRNCEKSQERESAESYCLRNLKEKDEFEEAIQILQNYMDVQKVEKPDKFYCIMDILNDDKKMTKSKNKTYCARRSSKEKISLNSSLSKSNFHRLNFKSPENRRLDGLDKTPKRIVQYRSQQPSP